MLKKLFEPFSIGGCEIPNRLVVPAMVTNYCNYDGTVTERYIRYMEEKARGGWGLIITEDYCVQPDGKGYSRIPGLYKDEQIEGSQRLCEAVHRHDSKIFCQMYHPGRQTTPAANNNTTPLAPVNDKDPMCRFQAREMTVDEIHRLVSDFGAAAGRAKRAGFDGVELHCAHGYLLAEFLSPSANRRVDEYGGCFDNRVRIVDEIMDVMRAEVGPDFPIQVRISSDDLVPGGRTIAETLELARHLEEIGFAAINCSNGMYASKAVNQIIAPMFTDHALNMDRSELIRRAVDIPVLLSNRVNDPKMADVLIDMGVCDAVCMGRGSIADPYLPAKAREGKDRCIRYCIGCLQGCEWPLLQDDAVTCLVNPRVGREYEDEMETVVEPRRVMVIGAGPAGLIAAETAAKRGHAVTVYEATDHLGGQFRSAAFPVGKGELSTFVSQLRESLTELGVPIRLQTPVTEELVEAEKPDAVIIATGAVPLLPPIPGIDGKNVVSAEDILLGNVEIADGPIVVCGGGEVGSETAHFITRLNGDVTVLEMQGAILNDMMPFTRSVLLEMMDDARITVRTNATVKAITETGVTYTDETGGEHTVPAAQVVAGFGYRSHNPLEDIARAHCGDIRVVGGAVKAGNAVTAAREGYEAGLAV